MAALVETKRGDLADEYRKRLKKALDDAGVMEDKAVERALELIGQCRREIAAELNSVPLTKWKAAYLNNTLDELNKIVDKYMDRLGASITDDQLKAIKYSDDFTYITAPEDWPGYSGISADLPLVLQGMTADLVKGLGEETKAWISREVRIGILKGESPYEVMQKLGPNLTTAGTRFKSVAYRAELIARTEMATAQSMASLSSIRRAQEIDPDVKTIWVANPGACDRCLEYDGKIFEAGEEETPPLHPNCRCSICAHKDEWVKVEDSGNEPSGDN